MSYIILLMFGIAAYMDGEAWMSGILIGISGTLMAQAIIEIWNEGEEI